MKPVFSLAFAFALALQAGAALAHAGLESTVPADGATVAAPQAIAVTFTEAVSAKMSGLTVTAPDGGPVETGAATLSDDGATLTVPLAAPLAAGPYRVDWRALSDDGHKTRGHFSFTVK